MTGSWGKQSPLLPGAGIVETPDPQIALSKTVLFSRTFSLASNNFLIWSADW